MAPHSLTLTMVGASLLWVGWFGFNAGSALEANGFAALAFINTFAATAAAVLAWCVGEALMRGKRAAEAAAEMHAAGLPQERIDALLPHRVFAGNRPSNTLLLDRLDPRTLGALIALYEHRTFVQGVVWGVNPFDQWGVELGKQLAGRVLEDMDRSTDINAHDASTTALIDRYRRGARATDPAQHA